MATSEKGNKECEKETQSTEMLENIQALKKLFLSVSAEKEEINKDNQQKFDELSERLKSIEASISKIQKSNEETQKPKDDSKKESINESLVPTDNTTNVLSESEKRFKLKHVFKNVNKFEDDKQNFSEWEDHFNVNSRMCVARRNNHLGFYVQCEPVVPTDIWSIQTKIELKIVQKNRKDVIETMNYCYEKIIGHGFPEFLEWEQLEKEYIVEGNLTVEAHVSIIQTTGLGKEKNRLFDESQKDVSDVVMVVRGIKFFVSKMFLASQSSVFKALLLGSFSESKQSEVSLNGIDPDDFHFFLEVLYGESAINDANVEGMTLLADMYDSPTAIRRCEEFLLKESKKKLVKKLDIAIRYHLEKLKKKCMSEIVILEDQAVVSKHAYH